MSSPLSCPSMREYMLRRPNTLRKYHEAELTLQDSHVQIQTMRKANNNVSFTLTSL